MILQKTFILINFKHFLPRKSKLNRNWTVYLNFILDKDILTDRNEDLVNYISEIYTKITTKAKGMHRIEKIYIRVCESFSSNCRIMTYLLYSLWRKK